MRERKKNREKECTRYYREGTQVSHSARGETMGLGGGVSLSNVV